MQSINSRIRSLEESGKNAKEIENKILLETLRDMINAQFDEREIKLIASIKTELDVRERSLQDSIRTELDVKERSLLDSIRMELGETERKLNIRINTLECNLNNLLSSMPSDLD